MSNAKNNIRSFRYSDRVAQALDAAEGKTLNEKFENLVLECYDRIPEVRREYEMYKRWVSDEKRQMYNLMNQRKALEAAVEKLDSALEVLGQMADEVVGDRNT